MKRARTRLALRAAAVLIGASVGCAFAEEDEPGDSRWPIKTTVPAIADLKHPKDVPLVVLLALGIVPGVRGDDPRYQDQRIPPDGRDIARPVALIDGPPVARRRRPVNYPRA